ncbi:MAG: tetratricopeptide repeat protein [Acidobacteria bacterium]|nr:tetratricopeptide repeat protein [Acidobacteriota bacterium]
MDLQSDLLNTNFNSPLPIDYLLAKQRAELIEPVSKNRKVYSDSNVALQLFLRGHGRAKVQDWQGAVEAYKELVKIVPVSTSYHLLGIAYLNSGKLSKAANIFEKSVKLNPKDADTQVILGTIYIQLGKPTKALNPLREARLLNPQLAEASFLLGYLHSKLHHWSLAIDAYEETIKHDRKFIPAYLYLAKIYLGLSRTNKKESKNFLNKAIKTCQELLGIETQNIGALNALGELYHALGRLEDAEKVLEKALKLDPKNADALNQLRLVKEDQLEQRLFEQGFLKKINKPITDFTPYKNRKLIKLHGQSLSETVIEERR